MHIDLAQIVAIAEGAGHRILAVYNSDAASDFTRKADDSPITQADKASNAFIVAQLRQHYPEIPIISEEEPAVDFATRTRWPLCWQVDPLDGTKEFLRRNGEFAVNIALVQAGEAIAGVIHAPYLRETAWAQRGQGAFMRDAQGVVHALTSGPPALGKRLQVLASRSHLKPEITDFLDKLPPHDLQRMGSSLKYIRLASGAAHFYPRLGPTMEWDTSAGQVILEEAGGELIAEDTQTAMRYNRVELRNGNFMAYGKGIREFLKR